MDGGLRMQGSGPAPSGGKKDSPLADFRDDDILRLTKGFHVGAIAHMPFCRFAKFWGEKVEKGGWALQGQNKFKN